MSEQKKASEPHVDLSSSDTAELREIKARRIIRNYSTGALLIGLIPVPLLDVALAVALQVRMLQQLSLHYGYKFESEQRVYSVLGSLFGGAALPLLLMPLLVSLIKFIPVLGTMPAMVAMPMILGSCSYATGRTFMQHFEAGGTLLSFNPVKARQVLRAYYQEGRKEAQAPSTPGATAA